MPQQCTLHSADFKATVAPDALSESKTLAEIGTEKPVKLNKSRGGELDGADHLNRAIEQEALKDGPD